MRIESLDFWDRSSRFKYYFHNLLLVQTLRNYITFLSFDFFFFYKNENNNHANHLGLGGWTRHCRSRSSHNVVHRISTLWILSLVQCRKGWLDCVCFVHVETAAPLCLSWSRCGRNICGMNQWRNQQAKVGWEKWGRGWGKVAQWEGSFAMSSPLAVAPFFSCLSTS